MAQRGVARESFAEKGVVGGGESRESERKEKTATIGSVNEHR